MTHWTKPINLLAAAAVCAALASPAVADVKDGVDAWSRGDYKAAISQWRGPAERGDADAQFNLAQAYKLGRGVDRDLAKAEDLFGKAAARGHLQASDNYGLLLFERGERARAMPFVKAAAGRGDPRARYLLGLAHFNGDLVEKDWVRAYALVSLAQQSGLPQAAPALAQMDAHVPLDQRRESVALATKLAAEAEANRRRQVAAAELSGTGLHLGTTGGGPSAAITAQDAVAQAAQAGRDGSPASAGADYTRPRTASRERVPQVAGMLDQATPKPASKPKPAPAQPKPVPKPAAASPAGPWNVQLGAFGVAGNADRMWNKVKGRGEVAGREKATKRSGNLTRLLASGYASQGAASDACASLKRAGISCLVTKD